MCTGRERPRTAEGDTQVRVIAAHTLPGEQRVQGVVLGIGGAGHVGQGRVQPFLHGEAHFRRADRREFRCGQPRDAVRRAVATRARVHEFIQRCHGVGVAGRQIDLGGVGQ